MEVSTDGPCGNSFGRRCPSCTTNCRGSRIIFLKSEFRVRVTFTALEILEPGRMDPKSTVCTLKIVPQASLRWWASCPGQLAKTWFLWRLIKTVASHKEWTHPCPISALYTNSSQFVKNKFTRIQSIHLEGAQKHIQEQLGVSEATEVPSLMVSVSFPRALLSSFTRLHS